MSEWNDPHWQSRSAEIDVEHRKLNQMLSALKAVVMRDIGLGLDDMAIQVLSERMRLHFQMEEDVAKLMDGEACLILREDHARLLSLMDQVGAALDKGQRPQARDHLQTFERELRKHDAEVDIPLFRMMAAGHDPLASI